MISQIVCLSLAIASIFCSKLEVITEDRPIEVNMMPIDKKEAVMRFETNKKFTFEKNGFAIAELKNDSLHWNVHANVSYFKVTGGLSHVSTVGDVKVAVRNWQLVYLDNFSSGDKNAWQGAQSTIKQCGPSKDKSLFRDCKTKVEYLEKKFSNLGPHNEVMVEMIFHFIDQWQSELAYLQIEDDIVWTKSHNWCHTIFNHKCMLNGVNVCEEAYPDLVGQNVKFVYKHNKPVISVRIGSSLAMNNCNATWGFNNFMIYVR